MRVWGLLALLFQADLLFAQNAGDLEPPDSRPPITVTHVPLATIITGSKASEPGNKAANAAATTGQAPVLEHLVSFDPDLVELTWTLSGWQLRLGTLVKDFGHNEMAARQLQLVLRELRLNQYGSVGGSSPVFEYYLCNGQAPQGLATGLCLSTLDQPSLHVARSYGQWCVCDAYRILFNFGNNEEDAHQTLAILRKYNFTRVGSAGYGSTTVRVFLTRPGDEFIHPPRNATSLEALQNLSAKTKAP